MWCCICVRQHAFMVVWWVPAVMSFYLCTQSMRTQHWPTCPRYRCTETSRNVALLMGIKPQYNNRKNIATEQCIEHGQRSHGKAPKSFLFHRFQSLIQQISTSVGPHVCLDENQFIVRTRICMSPEHFRLLTNIAGSIVACRVLTCMLGTVREMLDTQ